MTNVSNDEIKRAVEECAEAFQNFHHLLEKYCPVFFIPPGAPIPFGKPLAQAAYKEIVEAQAKFKEACQKEEDALRRLMPNAKR